MSAKNILQERCQKAGAEMPVYAEVTRTGPPHQPMFIYSVNAMKLSATGQAQPSKVAAQQSAATSLLSLISPDTHSAYAAPDAHYMTLDDGERRLGKLVLIIDVETRPDVNAYLDMARRKVQEVECIVVCTKTNAFKIANLVDPLIRRVTCSSKDAADLACVQLFTQALLADDETTLVAVVTGNEFGATACSVARELFNTCECASISWNEALSQKIDDVFSVDQ